MSLRNDKVYKAELMNHTLNASTIHMNYSSSAHLQTNFSHDSQIHTNKKKLYPFVSQKIPFHFLISANKQLAVQKKDSSFTEMGTGLGIARPI